MSPWKKLNRKKTKKREGAPRSQSGEKETGTKKRTNPGGKRAIGENRKKINVGANGRRKYRRLSSATDAEKTRIDSLGQEE